MPGEMYGITARLAIGSQGPGTPIIPVFIVTNALGDGLRLEWTVEKTRTSTPDTATIVIYNLLEAYRTILAELSILQGRIALELAIGWRGSNIPAEAGVVLTPANVLFTGEDWRVVAGEQVGPDIVTTIDAGDGYETQDQPPPGGSIAPLQLQFAIPIYLAALQLRPTKTALAEIQVAAAASGVPAFQLTKEDSPRETLDMLMASIGLSWGVSGGEFVVYRGGLRSDVLPAILAPQTGLIRWAELDDGAVEFEALARPEVVPGGQLTVLDNFGILVGGGPLRVDTIRFNGTTDGPSLMSGTARKVQVF